MDSNVMISDDVLLHGLGRYGLDRGRRRDLRQTLADLEVDPADRQAALTRRQNAEWAQLRQRQETEWVQLREDEERRRREREIWLGVANVGEALENYRRNEAFDFHQVVEQFKSGKRAAISSQLRQRQRDQSTVTLNGCVGDSDGDSKTCAICLDDLYHQDFAMLDCGHEYHTCCVEPWLHTNNICPLCKRTAIFLSDYQFCVNNIR